MNGKVLCIGSCLFLILPAVLSAAMEMSYNRMEDDLLDKDSVIADIIMIYHRLGNEASALVKIVQTRKVVYMPAKEERSLAVRLIIIATHSDVDEEYSLRYSVLGTVADEWVVDWYGDIHMEGYKERIVKVSTERIGPYIWTDGIYSIKLRAKIDGPFASDFTSKEINVMVKVVNAPNFYQEDRKFTTKYLIC